MAKVAGLAVGPKGVETRIHREKRDALEFVAGEGVVGDKTRGLKPDRQVNLLDESSYLWFEQSFARTRPMPGGLGEQVVVSADLDVNRLPLGARLRVGSAVLEVVSPRAPCETLAKTLEIEKPYFMVGHVGVLCRVLQSGTARVGDPVSVEPHAAK